MLMERKNLAEFAALTAAGTINEYTGNLKVGVDLGTANIVIAVVDGNDRPIAGVTAPSTVVKDGIVVDYVGAVQTVRKLKQQLETQLGQELIWAATAIPPGISEGNVRCITNVVEGAGFEVNTVIDEPTAAAKVLAIHDGAVVDVGGGTTGISILKNGKVTFTADEATGGTHMTLVLAGYYGISFAEAEHMKKNWKQEADVFPLIIPVIEKMAVIVKKAIGRRKVPTVYVVGGAGSFKKFEDVFEKILGIPTMKPNDGLFVTPLGIAMSCQND